MRRLASCLAVLSALSAMPAAAQQRTQARPSGPPHAWLFGSWTGGLFPVLDGALAQDCRTQPTVIFGQDTLAHASLIGANMAQRIIETVRTTPQGAEFKLTPDPEDPAGFGCVTGNDLSVERSSDGAQIAFPHCAAFPYPLHRCPG